MRNLLSKYFVIVVSLYLGFPPLANSQSDSQTQWWFNVELIVFKRTLLPTNDEDFSQAEFTLDTANSNNLLYFQALLQASKPDSFLHALPLCDARFDSQANFDARLDFEFSATPRLQTPITANASGADASAEQALATISRGTAKVNIDMAEESTADVNPFTVESNQALLSALLAPFALQATYEDDTIGSIIDTLSQNNMQRIEETSTVITDELDLASESVTKLKEIMQTHESHVYDVACKSEQSQAPALSQFVLPTIDLQLLNSQSHFTWTEQVLSSDELAMQDYAQAVFKQRDLRPLLYTAWRQEVKFGSENAEFYRVRAGDKLEVKTALDYGKWQQQDYQALVDLESDNSSFFDGLRTAIESNEDVDWLLLESSDKDSGDDSEKSPTSYELEGQIKVFLDYVNQVPYLHIDSEFYHYRLEIDADKNTTLTSYPLKQRRRIISKQIHYFDHPAFGVIVRLERFNPPIIDETESLQ